MFQTVVDVSKQFFPSDSKEKKGNNGGGVKARKKGRREEGRKG